MRLIRKFVYKNLKLNKKRTIVTIIGIILSMALLSAVATMVSSFRASLITYEKIKTGDYHVAYLGANEEDLQIFDNNRAIESYYSYNNIGYAVLAESKNEYKPYCRILSTDENGINGASLQLTEGRFPKNASEIVIPKHLKSNGYVTYKIGDVIKLQVGQRVMAQDKSVISSTTNYLFEDEELIDTQTKEYTVVGIIERPGNGIEAYECPGYSFITTGEKAVNSIDVYTRFTQKSINSETEVIGGIIGVDADLLTKAEKDESKLTDKEQQSLAEQMGNARFEISLNSWLLAYEKIWPVDRAFQIVFFLAVIVLAIIILTSVYCIKNSFSISVSEKIRQYGMLASIGATGKQIRRSVLAEAVAVGIIGIPLGLAFGSLAAYMLIGISNYLLKEGLNFQLIYVASWPAIILAIVLGIITIYLSAIGSARKAAKVSPMEAIRNQKEIKLSAKKLKAPKYVSRWWGIGGLISYKNIKRNKRKYRTTVVSIVICTTTFIVISYFMSMAVQLATDSYGYEESNLEISISIYDDYQLDSNRILELDHVNEYVFAQTGDFILENHKLTDLYAKIVGYSEADDLSKYIDIIAINDQAFDIYAKNAGIDKCDGKVIVVNSVLKEWQENGARKSGEVTCFDYKAGDTIKGIFRDSSGEEFDENGDIIDDSIKEIECNLQIGGITDKRPMGYMNSTWSPMIFMSQSTAKEMGLQFENTLNFFIKSDDADALEEELDQFVAGIETDNCGYSLQNREKYAREEKSLFLLLDIFTYGFIIVIALIGITNIVNTLGTSMELRAREFATLRSIGMTDRQFRKMVRLESLFTSAKSLIIGVSAGMLISYLINWIECKYDVIIKFHPPVIEAGISVAVVLAMIYTIISLSMAKINRRNIIDTIKNENL